MYVSTSGRANAEIEVTQEDEEGEITITCYPSREVNVYISISPDEAELLYERLGEILAKIRV